MSTAAISTNLRILVTGREGQIGWELSHALSPLGEVTATGRVELNLTSKDSIHRAIQSTRPHLIVNAAAYTAVDRAESEPELARQINADAVAMLATEAKAIGAAMIHYSTDYVFDGTQATPYTEADAPHPLSVYGQTKLGGEQALAVSGIPHLVLRTSWVYGARGHNFLRTILKLASEKPILKIVHDQTGAPTWSRDIAEATAKVVNRWMHKDKQESGIYHMTAAGDTTWYGFTKEALHLENNTSTKLVPITTAEYPTPAARPKNSRLDCGKLARDFECRLPHWKDSLTQVIHQLGDEKRLCAENEKIGPSL